MELRNIEENESNIIFDKVNEPMNIEFQNINHQGTRKDRQNNLKNISGAFYSGRLSAIIGSNRSSKTALLNLLAGLQSNRTASHIQINGQALNTSSIRKKSSYIAPHNYLLHSRLTTFETLKFAAEFQLSRKMSNASKLQLINNIIEELNLNASRNLIVTKLSESQRNLLAAGIGLIKKSSILYFDLRVGYFDDKALMLVLRYLKVLVAQGRTIICALDQPTTKMLQHFDDVMLLADGQSIYCGPCNKIEAVFSNMGRVRPTFMGQAEFILDIASQNQGDLHVNGQYQELTKNIHITTTDGLSHGQNYQNSTYPIPCWSQFLILMRRSILSMRRDIFSVHLRLIVHIIFGVLLGLVFFDIGNNAAKILENTQLVCCMLLFVFYVNFFANIISITADTAVFLQDEKHHYYSAHVYFLVKILTELFQHIIGSSVFLAIVYFMTQQPRTNFVYIWTVVMLLAVVSLGKSLVIATALQNSMLQIYTILFISLPMIIFSGMIINFNSLPPEYKPAIYISNFRYAFEGSMHSIYGFNRTKLICAEIYCTYKHPSRYLNALFSSDGMNYWDDVKWLGVWMISLFVLFYAVIKLRVALRK